MTVSVRLLHIEDNEDDAVLIQRALKRGGVELTAYQRVETAQELHLALNSSANTENGWDLILSDFSLPHFDGLNALEICKKSGLDIPFILISGTIGETTAVHAMKSGAHDYIMKDELARLVPAIIRELGEAEMRRQHKQAIEELRQGEERFRIITSSALDAVILMDHEGNAAYWNPAAEKMFGYTKAEILGKDVHATLVPERYREAFTAGYREFKHTGKGRAIGKVLELTARHKDGREIPVEIALAAIPRAGSYWASALIRDITERKQAEEDRENLQAQFNQAQKMESIGRLAGGVAHDLNNLLTPIIGYGEMLLRDFTHDDLRRQSVEEIHKAGLRAKDLVQQLLAFSRKQPLEVKTIHLNEVLEAFRLLLRRTLREDIEIEVNLEPKIEALSGDVGQIEQVIMNLAVNAQDAMPTGGKISIETGIVDLDEDYAKDHTGASVGKHILLAISDTGHGMEPQVCERIFEPFFTTKKKGEGTGLGLATVYGIVRQHGGSIYVYSEPGKGTTFKVYFPVSEEVQDSVKPTKIVTDHNVGSETIMLVEDDKMVRNLSIKILEKSGYKVITAGNGEECLDILSRQQISVDLLLTDVIMPGMSGKELYEEVHQRIPDLKVVYMSGYTDSVIVHHGVLGKSTAFIQKPFSTSGLLSKVREVLDNS